jgi:hypothetical protein
VEVRKTDSEITVKKLGVAKQQAHNRELRSFNNTEWKILKEEEGKSVFVQNH